MSTLIQDSRVEELDLQLKGLVHVRALLEMRGAPTAELAKYAREARRVRAELAALTTTYEGDAPPVG